MKRHLLLFLLLLGALAFPERALADAGTPLMWAGMVHLVVGNALIAVGDGLLLAWLFSLPKGKCVWIMLPANYASAWVGGLFIRGAIVAALAMDLNNGCRWFWFMVIATYGMTLILEWPFVAWCFSGAKNWLKRSLHASLVVQSASYALLFGRYWMASGTSLYTEMNIVAPANISLPRAVLVFFIASADGNVYQRSLAGGEVKKVYDLHSSDKDDRLFVRPSKLDSNRWDLVARLNTKDRRDGRFVEVLTNLPVIAAADWRSTHSVPPQYERTWFNFGEVPMLGTDAESQWMFHSGFWPVEGLRASNKLTSERIGFSYETPFGAWIVRNAVQLPSDKVLFQLGDDQICVFDPVNRRVALLWHGRGPAPVIEEPNVTQGGPASGGQTR